MIVLYFLVSLFVTANSEVMKLNNFAKYRALNHMVLSEEPLVSFYAKHKFDCVSKCGQEERCLVASYNAGERWCRLYEDGTGVSTAATGWRSWRAVDCLIPPPLPNGEVNYHSRRWAHYSCNTGYNFLGTGTNVICTEDGTWTGLNGTCEPVECGAPTSVQTAQANFTDTTYGSLVTFTCDLGYDFSGNSQQATCDENGQWVGFSGSCDAVRDCWDIQGLNPTAASGVYSILPTVGSGPISVYCDMTDDGGGWTVIQRRTDGSEDFYRGWTDYKNGFGTLNNEFWLGNINIWRLTNGGNTCELKVDLEDWEGNKRSASYSSFSVDSESNVFNLDVDGFSGDAGNSLLNHDEEDFSTHDNDNDGWDGGNCAVRCVGAWWYADCMYSNLNGEYNDTLMGEGVNWESFRGREYSLKYTAMKIRPRQSTSN